MPRAFLSVCSVTASSSEARHSFLLKSSQVGSKPGPISVLNVQAPFVIVMAGKLRKRARADWSCPDPASETEKPQTCVEYLLMELSSDNFYPSAAALRGSSNDWVQPSGRLGQAPPLMAGPSLFLGPFGALGWTETSRQNPSSVVWFSQMPRLAVMYPFPWLLSHMISV